MAQEINKLTVGPVRATVFRVEEEGKTTLFFLKLAWEQREPTWFRLTEQGPVLMQGELRVSAEKLQFLKQKVAPWTPKVVVGGKE